MNNKLLKAFEEDFTRFSDEYFSDAANLKRIEHHKTSIEELIELQREYFFSLWIVEPSKVVNNKSKLYSTFPLDVDCAISAVYKPDKEYLSQLVAFLEKLSNKENAVYFEYAITYDPAETYGASAHCEIVSSLAVDNNYLFSRNARHGDNFIVSDSKRFSGLLPFLYYNDYQELYERVFQFCRLVMKKFSYKSGKMVLAILNFLKENDSERYNVFKKDFDEIRKQDESVWIKPLLSGHYGNGYKVRKEYLDTPFLKTIE